MANELRYEVLSPKANKNDVRFATARQVSLEAITCTSIGVKARLAAGAIAKEEGRQVMAHAVAKLLSDAGRRAASEAASRTDADFSDLRDALKAHRQIEAQKEAAKAAEAKRQAAIAEVKNPDPVEPVQEMTA